MADRWLPEGGTLILWRLVVHATIVNMLDGNVSPISVIFTHADVG